MRWKEVGGGHCRERMKEEVINCLGQGIPLGVGS